MSTIHYFQRYNSKENVVTNTILHLFSRIHSYSPYRLTSIINEICGEEIPIGLLFEQQKRASASVPDGTISQQALEIRIETKTEATLCKNQLRRHCEDFIGEGKILLVITPKATEKKVVDELKKELPQVRISFCTFKQLCDIVFDEFHDYETSIRLIVDDFIQFCADMNLLPAEGILRVVPCGTSFELNKQYHCYSHPSMRGYSPHDYIGLYLNKSVKLIGKVSVAMDVKVERDGVAFNTVDGIITDSIKNSIKGMINDSNHQLGWDFSHSYTRFFCFDELFETDYHKISKGGIQGNRYIDISEFIGDNKDNIESIANRLRNEEWT